MKKVFCLDDSKDFLNLLKLLIAAKHYAVVTASNYRETLNKKQQLLEADLAILDINLGPNEPSGVDVYKWLKDQGFHGSVLFLTGHAENSLEVQTAKALSGAHVLAKPVPSRQLMDTVASLV